MKATLKNYSEEERKVLLTFEVDIRDLRTLPEGDLDLIIKKWKSPRSREALNYLWHLVSEMAMVLSQESAIGKDELYKELVNRHGILMRDDSNQLMKLVIKAEIDPLKLDMYLHDTVYTTELDGTLYKLYYLVKPPHEYNSREFAQFIDQVAKEARKLGVETLTEKDLRSMKC